MLQKQTGVKGQPVGPQAYLTLDEVLLKACDLHGVPVFKGRELGNKEF